MKILATLSFLVSISAAFRFTGDKLANAPPTAVDKLNEIRIVSDRFRLELNLEANGKLHCKPRVAFVDVYRNGHLHESCGVVEPKDIQLQDGDELYFAVGRGAVDAVNDLIREGATDELPSGHKTVKRQIDVRRRKPTHSEEATADAHVHSVSATRIWLNNVYSDETDKSKAVYGEETVEFGYTSDIGMHPRVILSQEGTSATHIKHETHDGAAVIVMRGDLDKPAHVVASYPTFKTDEYNTIDMVSRAGTKGVLDVMPGDMALILLPTVRRSSCTLQSVAEAYSNYTKAKILRERIQAAIQGNDCVGQVVVSGVKVAKRQ